MIRLTRMFAMPIMLTLICLMGALPLTGTSAAGGGAPPSQMGPVLVQDLGFSEKEPVEHDEITLNATLVNNVSIELSNITVHFLVDMKEIGNISGLQIGINGSLAVQQRWKASKYNHTVSVLVSVDGQLMRDSQINKGIYVEAEPIGDFTTPVLLIAALLLTLLATVAAPGILERFKPPSMH
jgi:hypothetical protein